MIGNVHGLPTIVLVLSNPVKLGSECYNQHNPRFFKELESRQVTVWYPTVSLFRTDSV